MTCGIVQIVDSAERAGNLGYDFFQPKHTLWLVTGGFPRTPFSFMNILQGKEGLHNEIRRRQKGKEMKISIDKGYDENGAFLAIHAHVPYKDLQAFEVPKSCTACPSGYIV